MVTVYKLADDWIRRLSDHFEVRLSTEPSFRWLGICLFDSDRVEPSPLGANKCLPRTFPSELMIKRQGKLSSYLPFIAIWASHLL